MIAFWILVVAACVMPILNLIASLVPPRVDDDRTALLVSGSTLIAIIGASCVVHGQIGGWR